MEGGEKYLLHKHGAQLDNMSAERLADYGVYDGGLLVEAQGTPDMTVKVSAGIVYMPTTFKRYSIATTASLAVTAADATNPRYDIVYVSPAGVVSYLAGTAAASPTVPTTPSGAVKLAELYVTANKTSIVAGDITLRRWFLESGGWTTWTPTITWETANPVGVTATAKYKVIGKTLFFNLIISATDGNGATIARPSLPFNSKTSNIWLACSALSKIGSGSTSVKTAYVTDDGNTTGITCPTGALTAGSTASIRISGFYEIA